MDESCESGDDVIPLNEESQVALLSDENECVAVPLVIPSFNLNEGSFDRATFGPQTNTKHVEANTIEHATITHVHHHYGDNKTEESPSTSNASAARPKQELEEGYFQVTDDIFMNTKKPLKEGIKIYEGYQEHVTGQRQLLAIKAIIPYTKKSIREVQHLVTLAPHPNVVRIISSKERQTPLPTLYIAMELCGSNNLHDYLKENRDTPLNFKKTMLYSKRLVEAMEHIHRNRIIHGDLKPENILFSLDGDQIKISDFGISKELQQSRSSTKRTSQGTDGYRAPETYNSDIISMKADIYSLGVTLHSIWTNGKHPFGPNPNRWAVNIMDNIGRDLSGLPEEMGAKKDEFLNLLDQMLQFNPENRPTIEEISQHRFFSSSQATAQVSSDDIVMPNHDQKKRAEYQLRPARFSLSENNASPPGVDEKIEDEKKDDILKVGDSKRMKLNKKITGCDDMDTTNIVQPADSSSTTDKGWVFGGATQVVPTFESIAAASFTSLSSDSAENDNKDPNPPKDDGIQSVWEPVQNLPFWKVALNPESSEYQSVCNRYVGTGGDGSVIKIERIQNVSLYEQYIARKAEVTKKIASGNLVERQLFCGTADEDKIILNGFDRSYAGRDDTSLGMGMYFSLRASCSLSYAVPSSQGHRRMFLVDVITGDFCRGQSFYEAAPRKPTVYHNDLYDSVVDDVNLPKIWVIFDVASAYPKYLITFTL